MAGVVNKTKVRRCCCSICGAALLMSLLLAGHGGEGERRHSLVADRFSGWRGFLSVLARRRGAGRSSSRLSGELPRWKTAENIFEADPLNKRHYRLSGGSCDVIFLSAGRGGEGEEGNSLGVAGVWRCFWEFLESAPCGGTLATTSYGRRYPRPEGWPRHARQRLLLECLLPPPEDLSQSRCSPSSSFPTKWPSPR